MQRPSLVVGLLGVAFSGVPVRAQPMAIRRASGPSLSKSPKINVGLDSQQAHYGVLAVESSRVERIEVELSRVHVQRSLELRATGPDRYLRSPRAVGPLLAI